MVDIAANTSTTAAFEGDASFRTYSGEFETFGDTDWIKVTLTGGRYSFFGSAETPGGADSVMRLLNAAGVEVAMSDDDGVGNNAYFYFEVSAPATFYVELKSYSGDPGVYSVAVSWSYTSQQQLLTTADDSVASSAFHVLGGLGDDSITMVSDDRLAVGEQGDDRITGNSSDNRLSGGLGNDTIYGQGGIDRLFGDAGLDFIDGGSEDDLIYGGAGSDSLRGGYDNDTIFTGPGTDGCFGEGGNDTFHVESAADRVTESGGQGTDTIFTTASYALLAGSEIEVLRAEVAASTAALNLTGNEYANTLIGNNGTNVLNGGGGTDVLRGLGGNDVYVLAGSSDGVADTAGIDTATSAINRSLLVGGLVAVENLTLTGAAAANGIGNNSANILTGNNAVNTLDGGTGNDRLVGLGGNDILIGWVGKDTSTGGAGNNTFRFRTASHSPIGANADVITDFDDANDDRIDLSAVYGGVLAYRHNLAFTGVGQVRINDIAGADLLVEVNTGGSLAADLQIRLTATSLAAMSAGDFIL